MLRRHFLLSGFAFLVTFDETLAESSRVWRVAYVASGVAGKSFEALRSALRDLGYQEGKNLILDLREANGDYSLLPDLAREAVSLKPDVIVAVATPAIAAVQKVTSTIPIVMSPATDPVGSGFVRSFAHPGGNITGVANMFGDLTAKTLDILHLVLPQVRKIGVLVSNNPTHLPLFEIAKRGAERIGISAERFIAETPDDLETAFKAMKSANCEAVYVLADPPRYAIPALAVKFSLPVIYQIDTFVQIGGLMSYGPDLLAMNARGAYYVDRILKGGNPADIPVEQPTTFQFIINLRAAKAIGLSVPESVLLQADKVME
jgi:putative tryptophan/tyrosine transport system substrate-binding protein